MTGIDKSIAVIVACLVISFIALGCASMNGNRVAADDQKTEQVAATGHGSPVTQTNTTGIPSSDLLKFGIVYLGFKTLWSTPTWVLRGLRSHRKGK